ncbi:MAG: NAD+ synthase [Candidatus Omnitrophota bacterium]
MKVTIAQLNPTIGDISGNLSKMTDLLARYGSKTDLVVFSELFLTGYPPKDLLEKPWFIKKIRKAIDEVVRNSASYPETGILFGTPVTKEKERGKELYNSAVLIHNGRIIAVQHKSLLPTYDVFDETRYFDAAPEIKLAPFKGEVLGISVCEDAWNDPELWPGGKIYTLDPLNEQAKKGATLFVNIAASPFYAGKEKLRYRLYRNHSLKHKKPFVYVNQVGANDDLIFDGRSMCFDSSGEPIEISPPFKEHVETVDTASAGKTDLYVPQDEIESVYKALVLGVSDYMKKCGFSKVVVGLSGGIDSAVTCCIAKGAIGKENVLALSMPSPYSSEGSIEDSKKLAEKLGVAFKAIPISDIITVYLGSLKEHFSGKEPGVAEENIQARIRGNLLMAFSNKFGYLLLSTGNKSELAVGYCTLYGDMSGGLAVISDVPKTMVYKLADYINKEEEIIPRAIIEKKPSAELRPEQFDSDTLPPYNILDDILYQYIEKHSSVKDIVKRGFEPETVKWVVNAVEKNEYKREQAPPGLKVTSKAFGSGRRMPIARKLDF